LFPLSPLQLVNNVVVVVKLIRGVYLYFNGQDCQVQKIKNAKFGHEQFKKGQIKAKFSAKIS